MAINYNTIQLSGTGSLVNEELTNGATLTITKTGGVQDITSSLTPHGTQTLLLFEVANGLSNQVPGLNKSDFALYDAGGVKLNTVYSTTNFGFLLPKGTYNSGTFTIATDLPTIPANTLRIRAIGVKKSGGTMVELDGAGAPVYNNKYSFEFREYPSEPYFATPDNSVFDLTDEFTISAWVRPHELQPPADECIIDKSTGAIGANAGNGWALYHDNNVPGLMSFDLKNGGVRERLQVSDIPATDIWYHVAVTYESSNAKMYINSVEKDDLTTPFASLGTNTQDVIVGASTTGGTANYSGSLQNVSIFSVAFNQTEINELYGGGNPPDLNNHSQVANGIAWWQFGGNGESGSFAANWTELNCFNNAQYVMTSANVLETDRITDTP